MSALALPSPAFAPHTRAEAGYVGEGLPPVLLRVAVSVLAVIATVSLGRLAMHRFDRPVKELAITGATRHVQPDEVRLAAAPLVDGSKLFALDLAAVQEAIEKLPWVARVRIERQWPARLAIRIVEREAFARWGETDALSTEGIVFAPGSAVLAATLPKLGGAEGREREVMAMYGALADQLSETPFALLGLTQDARGEWRGTTKGNVTLRLGRGDPLTQMPRLKTVVLPVLARRLDAVNAIDLRYANGFAVAWRDGAATQHSEPNPSQPAADSVQPGVTP